jgi:tetratricopeptide (TPR) repeat protein
LQDALADSLAELTLLSLVELDRDNNPLMHRLIHAFIRYRNQADHVSHFDGAAAALIANMAATFANPGLDVLRELEALLPDAEAMISSDRLTDAQTVDLLTSAGSHQQDIGRYRMARGFSAAALEKAEKNFEPGNPSIARSQSNLALVLQDLGQLEEARDLLKKALASFEQRLSRSIRPWSQ